MEILNVIGFDNLIMTSINDYIKTYYYDFKHNNNDVINILKLEEDMINLEKHASYFARLSCHFHEFYKYNTHLKSLSCIIAGFDSYKNQGLFNTSKNGETFFREWIIWLINNSTYNSATINDVYYKLMKSHKYYENIPLINFNLYKFEIL
jgi:hypothetical protein